MTPPAMRWHSATRWRLCEPTAINRMPGCPGGTSKPSWIAQRRPVSYRIRVGPEARKEIKALPGHVRSQARRFIRTLNSEPRPLRAKELRGNPNVFRIWLAGETPTRIASEDR